MNQHEYWWDRKGPSDPEIERLEALLSGFRYRPPHRSIRVGFLQAGVALAAALALFWIMPAHQNAPTGWHVRTLAGVPHIDSQPFSDHTTFMVGQWLTTDDSSAAVIQVGDRGQVRIEPRSRIQLISNDSLAYAVRLEEGMIHAAVWALPRRFMVETPAATAVDLGCEYTLAVDARGHGVLCVETGWVSLEHESRTSLVPSGAQCEMRFGIGPGTPYLAGASSAYLDMLRSFDFDPKPAARVRDLIEQASPCDAFSLVYLVDRVAAPERGKIFDRVAALYPPWTGITRDGIVALEASMVATWQDQFECFESEMCRASCLPDVL